MKGANVEELENLGLAKSGKKLEMSSFEYLKKSGCYDVPKIKDEILYKEVKESFSVIYILNFTIYIIIDDEV